MSSFFLGARPTDGDALETWRAGQLQASRGMFLTVVGALVALALSYWPAFTRGVRTFFVEKGSPLNLAILRIWAFLLLAQLVTRYETRFLFMTEFPELLRIPPVGFGWANNDFFFDPVLAGWALLVFKVAVWGAILGIFTRVSMVTATLLALYLIGLWQFKGKADHGPHVLMWTTMVIALAPCGHTLSIDALWRALRGKAPPATTPRIGYVLPIRGVWLLLGIGYFFPGLWKLWNCGLEWAFSDNLRFQMYAKWVQRPNWEPLARLDRWPLLLYLAGLGTIVFELGWVLLIFRRLGRRVALLSSWSFHYGVAVFMGIRFTAISQLLIGLLDWERLLRFVGKWVVPRPALLNVAADSTTGKRWARVVAVTDLLGRVETDYSTGVRGDQWSVHVGEEKLVGNARARALLLRLPILWPFVPLLAIAPLRTLGARLLCNDARTPRELKASPLLPAIVLTGLAVGNLLMGFQRRDTSWPATCMPPFDRVVEQPLTVKMESEVLDELGRVIELDQRQLRRTLGPASNLNIQLMILQIPRQYIDPYLQAYAGMLLRYLPEDSRPARIRFYQISRSSDPEAPTEPRRRFVREISLHPD